MRLPDSAIVEFQQLWKQELGFEIDSETAREYAEVMIKTMETILLEKRI